jgi:hypothetical protein
VCGASDPPATSLIERLLATSPFHSEGHRKVRVRLRQRGVHVGKAHVLRLMRAIDHATDELGGWKATKRGDRWAALELEEPFAREFRRDCARLGSRP